MTLGYGMSAVEALALREHEARMQAWRFPRTGAVHCPVCGATKLVANDPLHRCARCVRFNRTPERVGSAPRRPLSTQENHP